MQAVAHKRTRRWARAAIAFCLIIAAIGIGLRLRLRTRAVASAVYAPKYDPNNVLDGSNDNEWLLPDGRDGWIDLYLTPPRTVRRLKLVNAHNHEFFDRATKEFRVELYSKGVLVAGVDSVFPVFTATPPPVTVDLGEHANVSRIRIIIKSYYASGGGLAEVTVD